MKWILLIFFCFPLVDAIAQKNQLDKLTGTWVNVDLYRSILNDDLHARMDTIIPRCIYISKPKLLTIEYRFEQKSKRSPVEFGSIENAVMKFKSSGMTYSLINDSILVLSNLGLEIRFLKVSARAVVGDGIQAVFRTLFWGNCRNWKITTFSNQYDSSTVVASVTARQITILEDGRKFSEYEFTDVDRMKTSDGDMFGIDLYRTNSDNITISNSIFGIHKRGEDVILYKGGVVAYRFSPVRFKEIEY